MKASPTLASPPAPWRARHGLSYGALGLPLAFVALPLYVLLPHHYATQFGLPLAGLGAVLLGARAADALVDPWIGRLVDRWFAMSTGWVLGAATGAAVVLVLGFVALFFPPQALAGRTAALLAWCGAMLLFTYFAYSVLSVLHQAWGARLGGNEARRAGIVGWREGLALAGVLVASVLPALAGLAATAWVFALALAAGLAALARAPRPPSAAQAGAQATADRPAAWRAPWAEPAFRRLLAVYLVNGIASAIPATLVLFFIRDRLQAPSQEPLFLASYFAAAALSMPVWVRVVGRMGLARAWLGGMGLAIATFAWALGLGAGDVAGFAAVCVASGVALGADLAVPGALLAGVIQRAGHAGHLEGAYFGWWNCAMKLNLALAAGVALPALALAGYAPGARAPHALWALSAAYCALPCLLKAAAAVMLWRQLPPSAAPLKPPSVTTLGPAP